jgi:anti-sigma regulatory factor (Ser/Thr protein kinase)
MALSPRRATGTQRSSHTNLSGAGVPVRGGRVTKSRAKGRGKAQPKSEMLLKLELQSNPEALCLVRATVERAAEVMHFQDAETRAIVRSVDEALANVMRHAYGGRPGLPIEMSCHKLQGREENSAQGGIEILLTDKGTPVKPEALKGRPLDEIRPGGLGLHFIRQSMDEVEFTRKKGKNLLRMVKYLSPSSLQQHQKENGKCR